MLVYLVVIDLLLYMTIFYLLRQNDFRSDYDLLMDWQNDV